MNSFSSNDIFPEEKRENTNFPLSDPLNTDQIIEIESRKTKKIFIFGMILSNMQQTVYEIHGKIFLKKLKLILDAKNRFKLGFDKCHKIIKGDELNTEKSFFSQFLSQFATRKKLFDFTCYQKINVSRFPPQKNEFSMCQNTPKKKIQKVLQALQRPITRKYQFQTKINWSEGF